MEPLLLGQQLHGQRQPQQDHEAGQRGGRPQHGQGHPDRRPERGWHGQRPLHPARGRFAGRHLFARRPAPRLERRYLSGYGRQHLRGQQDADQGFHQAGFRIPRRQSGLAQRLPLAQLQFRIPAHGPSGRRGLLAHAGCDGLLRRFGLVGRRARCGRHHLQRQRPDRCAEMVSDRRQRRYHPAVLHLFGHELPPAGAVAGLHAAAQMVPQQDGTHRLVRGPQLVDDLLQGSFRPRSRGFDGAELSGNRLLHDAVAAQSGFQREI